MSESAVTRELELELERTLMRLSQLWKELTGDEAIPMSAEQERNLAELLLGKGMARRCEDCGSIVALSH